MIKRTTDLEKAAIMMISLGDNDAAEILRHLGPKEVQKIGETMARLDNVSQTQVETIMDEFLDEAEDQTGIGIGNDKYIRSMLTMALGDEKAKTLADRILRDDNTQGLDTLRWMEPRQVAEILRYEHPQIQTVVVSYLDPDQAAQVLAYFDERVRLDLILRIAAMDRVQPEAISELNDLLEASFATNRNAQDTVMGGVHHAASILNFAGNTIETQILSGIERYDAELAKTISELMFVFDNLRDMDNRSLQLLLRNTSNDQLVIALKGADSILQDKILGNVSERAAEIIRDDMEAKGPVRVKDVDAAQKEILAIAKSMAEEGLIMLGKGSEDMV